METSTQTRFQGLVSRAILAINQVPTNKKISSSFVPTIKDEKQVRVYVGLLLSKLSGVQQVHKYMRKLKNEVKVDVSILPFESGAKANVENMIKMGKDNYVFDEYILRIRERDGTIGRKEFEEIHRRNDLGLKAYNVLKEKYFDSNGKPLRTFDTREDFLNTLYLDMAEKYPKDFPKPEVFVGESLYDRKMKEIDSLGRIENLEKKQILKKQLKH